MPEKNELNQKLLEVCTSDIIDYDRAEELLQLGAEPMGVIETKNGSNNLFGAIAEELFGYECTTEDLYRTTKLFLKYGMDISKPSVPYNYSYVFHPFLHFIYQTNDWAIRTMELLLDNGSSAEDAREFWQYALGDFRYCPGDFDPDRLYDFVRKLMLVASYPHILKVDEKLRKEIWFDQNCYDLTRFRNWNDFLYEADFSFCEAKKSPDIYRSLVTIIEKDSGKKVWRFGIYLKPEDHPKLWLTRAKEDK